MRACTWSAMVFGLVVPVKWHSHECQDKSFLSKTVHFNKMINALRFTVHSPINVVADRCKEM